jgi:hypothetical protein
MTKRRTDRKKKPAGSAKPRPLPAEPRGRTLAKEALDMAYKATAYAGRGRLKLAPGKRILPGRKQIFESRKRAKRCATSWRGMMSRFQVAP